MIYDEEHTRSCQALRLARKDLQRREREFTRYLDPGDDQTKYIEALRQAEQRVYEARAKLLGGGK